jgi:mono/diheme cytochrome c family protein
MNTTTSFFSLRRMRALMLTFGLALAGVEAHAQLPVDTAQVQRGQYLATAGDCIACHSVQGGKPMAGGLAVATPLGAIVSTNITPSRSAGIGNYTLQQFADALRKGVRADGGHLYPAMPYTAYAKVSDADIAALYAYFMHGVQPVDTAPARRTDLPFPFNVRMAMAGWNLLFLDRKPFVADPAQNAEWNRGAYLANGLAHCTTCHTPRNALMAEDLSKNLAGGDLGTWYAPNITPDAHSGVGGWSTQELVEYLRSGRVAGKAQAAGPMAEAVDHSLRHLTDADLHAIATYVKSVPAVHDAADTAPVDARGSASNGMAYLRGATLPTDPDKMSGPQLFDAHCATCHQAGGQGSFDRGLPSLFHNTVLGRSNGHNLVMAMLDGVQREQSEQREQRPGDNGADALETRMPAFRTVMTDQQITTLANYLTATYGNPTVKVTADEVHALRAGGATSTLVTLARVGMVVGLIVVLGLLVWLGKRKKRRTASF